MPAERLSVSRRGLLSVPVAAAAATVAVPLLAPTQAGAAEAPPAGGAGTPPAGRAVDRSLTDPVARAYHYLNVVQDAYLVGDTPRLLQSYNNESGLLTSAFIYDNAVAVCAYLAHPTADNLRRARLIGDALLWVQNNDESATDGRVRQAYAAGPMQFYGGGATFHGLARDDGHAAFLWPFGFGGSSTGDIAWTGLALVQLYARTKAKKYLDGAVKLGTWITDKVAQDAYQGFHGGLAPDGTAQPWSSTEHNIDAYGLFTLLSRYTGDKTWLTHAARAKKFVRAMWNAAGKHLWTGTIGPATPDVPDGINRSDIPEDVHSWGVLSLADHTLDPGLDWVVKNLSNTDGGTGSELPATVKISGVTYATRSKAITGPIAGTNPAVPNHPRGVWLEGTAHLALALLKRNRHGDRAQAVHLLHQIAVAQQKVGAGQTVGLTTDPREGRLYDPAEGGTWTGRRLPAGCGIVAATSALDTGFGFGYFQRQHVGATGWFLLAAQGFNPYA